MSNNVLYDVERAIGVWFDLSSYNYRRVYPNTNENMKALFRNFNVEGKDVLCVLGSSDQVLSSFYLGANSVDSFDNNKLTFYYYYLRKWLITYLNEEYINEEFFKNGRKLYKLISKIKVEDKDEETAKEFWLNYLSKNCRIDKKLFIETRNKYDNLFKDDLSNLSKKIKRLGFYNYDLGYDFYLDKQYDILIISNIMECLRNQFQICIAKENIERLLKKDGICVCSHLMENKNDLNHKDEVGIMTMDELIEEDFNDYYLTNDTNKYREVGYVYKKRKL